MRRFALGVLTVAGLTSFGWVAGGMFATMFVIRDSDGFAAIPLLAVSVFAGAAAGFVLGLMAAYHVRADAQVKLALASVVLGVVAWPVMLAMERRRVARHVRENTPPLNANGRPFPPPLPARGTRDSLIGLVIAPDSMLAQFETREADYEVKAITVYGRAGDYYLAGMADSTRGWLHSADVGAFHPIEQLVVNRLNWLTPSWDPSVRDEPSARAPARAAKATRSREIPARVLESVMRPDGAWFRVEILDRSACDGATPKVIDSGWIPVWGADAKPTAWFYSRGC